MAEENYIIPKTFEVSINLNDEFHSELSGLISNNATSNEVLHFLLSKDTKLRNLIKDDRAKRLGTIMPILEDYAYVESGKSDFFLFDEFFLPDIIMLNITRLYELIIGLQYLQNRGCTTKVTKLTVDEVLNKSFQKHTKEIIEYKFDKNWSKIDEANYMQFKFLMVANLVGYHNPLTVDHVLLQQKTLIGLRAKVKVKNHL